VQRIPLHDDEAHCTVLFHGGFGFVVLWMREVADGSFIYPRRPSLDERGARRGSRRLVGGAEAATLDRGKKDLADGPTRQRDRLGACVWVADKRAPHASVMCRTEAHV
jgi:hypothetical protein